LPSTQREWLAVSKRFEERWNFPHAIGAIDGKHVNIVAPRDSGSEYFNYKRYFSIVLLVVVDADYNFIYADAGGKGGISDGGIFKNTRLYQRLENRQLNIPPPEPLRVPYQIAVPYFLLGDKAFAFTEYCIRPYGGVNSPDSMERTFNKRHSRARMPVENTLGILASRFRVLKGPIHLEPDVAKNVVLTTVFLHNFLRRRASRNTYTPPSAFDRVVDGQLQPRSFFHNIFASRGDMSSLAATSAHASFFKTMFL
uniref:DDE Tnp4 domain-containing protein n=1 Tax=Anopheles atroparvus TaxID=41427 RepID=A0AAG5D0Y1_ANOAO